MAYLQQKPQASKASPPESVVLHSSFLSVATYDHTNFALTITLKSGHELIHRYFFPVTWQQFKESPSPGSFYSRQIKGKYPTIALKSPLKSTDLTKAKKAHKPKEA